MRAIRRKRKRGRTAGGPAVLRMTSLMDILTVLLLFLLKSFVVEGETVTPPAGLDLPQSTSETLPIESIQLALMDQGLLIGDELVATSESIRNAPGYLIPGLDAKLVDLKTRSDRIAKLKGHDPALQHVTIQGDRDMEFAILQKVMATLSANGFEDISLAVVKRS